MADIYIGNIKGPQGVQGETGAQGPQGDAATIEVGTVSTTAYGNTAQVINSGTSSEAVFDFVIPQGRPGEETTTMSSLTLDTVTAQSAQYPVPATGESGSVVFGKIIKFFNDIKSAIVNKINYSDCVYNLTSTSNTLPLAASQGKALNDAITPLSSRLKSITCSNTTSAYVNMPVANRHYWTFLLMGMVGGYGSACLVVIVNNGTAQTPINLLTGQEFTGVSVYYDQANSRISVRTNYTQSSNLTLLIG